MEIHIVLAFIPLARTSQTLLSGAVKPAMGNPVAPPMRLRHRVAQSTMGPVAAGHLQKHKHISDSTLSDLWSLSLTQDYIFYLYQWSILKGHG